MALLNINLSILLIICGVAPLYFSLAGRGKLQLRKYNEPCILYDSYSACNTSQGLICLDSGLKGYRCLCPSDKLHAQLFDTKRNACVGKVFNACVRGGGNGAISSRQPLNESLCVENSECDTTAFNGLPICVCKAGYTEFDGNCVPSLKFGESCDNTSSIEDEEEKTRPKRKSKSFGSENIKKCDERHGLACIESKCQCRYPSEQYYDEKEGKCISFAEGRCTFDTHVYSCVPNAKCPAPPLRINVNTNSNNMHGFHLPPLPPFLSGITATAIAGDRIDENGEGDTNIFVMGFKPPRIPLPPPPPHRHLPPIHFHHSHPQQHEPHRPIEKDEPLMDFDSMRFDNIDFGGRSIFFGSTDKEEGKEKTDNYARCQCLPGFERTHGGWCMKSYGNKCSSDDEDSVRNATTANGTVRELCNADQFLECMDAHDGSFTCQCRNPMNERYDPERKECVAMVGRRCRPFGNYPKCEQGSICNGSTGICECGNGTSLTPMDTCAKNYGESCEAANKNQCNVWSGLTCHGKSKTCLCLDSYLKYEEKQGACVATKGEICGEVAHGSHRFYVGCEDGTECKEKMIGGQKVTNRCQ